MYKNVNCLIGLINKDNLVIFKFRKYKFNFKDNFINHKETGKTRMLANFEIPRQTIAQKSRLS